MNPKNPTEVAISKKKSKQAKVRDYEAHVLICKGSDCKKRGSKDVKKAMKNELRSVGMHRETRLDSVECLGLCKHGPNAIVYPGGTWYLGLDEKEAREVARSHIKGGEPVEHLAAEFRPTKKAN